MMADFFKEWVLSLAGVIVFGSMCEMILPGSSYKKYIHLAIGMMLILTVLTPIKNFKIYGEIEIPETNEHVQSIPAEQRQNKEILKVYKQKLSEDIKRELGDKNIDAECDIYEHDERFGQIKAIIIYGEADADTVKKLEDRYGLTRDKIVIKNSRGDANGS